MSRICWTVTALAAAVPAAAQVSPATQFEVASVRQNVADDHIVSIDVGPGNRFAARGYTLVLLIQRAYGVMGWNVSGGPDWIRTDRWDVQAKAPGGGNLTEARLQPMLQKLLAERFRLGLHNSTKETSGYSLVVAKGGAKLKAAAGAEDHMDTFRMGGSGLSGQGIKMEDFARFVAGKMGLIAVDHTGLKGFYDVKADWKVETAQPNGILPPIDPRDALQFAAFRAIEDQLGLKFEAGKITVKMLVIDRVEKAVASEN